MATIGAKKEALKVIRIERIADPDADLVDAFVEEQISRVRREVEALQKCRVAEMVKLGSIALVEFEEAGEKYVAYTEEYLAGHDLWHAIINHDALPPLSELVRLFRSLLVCVQELWGLGYVHRDIKPANVMRTEDAARPFVLMDLGIAYAVHEAGLTVKPELRMPLATHRYLAPEMMQPGFRGQLDFRTDLYTTGLTVFEYAAGQHPLARSADDLMRTITRALHQAPIPLKRLRADLPVEFCDLVDGMLKKKPALRPANMKRLLEKLEALT